MKVMFLGTRAADTRFLSGSVRSDADVVSAHCRVEVVHVFGASGAASRDAVPTRHLLDAPADGTERASRLVPVAWNPDLSVATDAALEQLLTKVRVDVVVTLDRSLLAAAVQLSPDRVRVVHRETSLSTQGLEALSTFAGQCDAVVADSAATAALVSSATGSTAVDLTVVPQGLTGARAVENARSAPPTILAPQGSGSVEHLELAIQGFGMVANQVAPWRLRVLARRGTHERLQRLVEELDLGDRVELAAPPTDWVPEWERASLGLLGSDAHGDRMTVVVAGAVSVPVVATDWPTGVRELIVNGRDGLRVQPRSVAGMAAALARLTSGSDEREAMGRASMLAAERFATPVVAEEWLGVLHRVTSTGGRQTRLSRQASRTSGPQVAPAPEAPTVALADVARVAETVDPGWFVVPASSSGDPLVVVVSTDARRRFLDGLSLELAEEPVSYLRLDPERDSSTAVEFWDHVAGARHAPWPNRFAAVVPDGAARAEIVVDGLRLPTLALMTRPTFRDRPFPIDVVYTWVDGADEQWRGRRDARLAQTSSAPPGRTSAGDARYLSRDELRHSMRSVHRFAPWVRKIFLVTDRQTPSWLVEHEQVQVVDHSEILSASALPTYNSHAIEAALHRIEGLSESFVYFNDDVFLGADVGPGELFGPSGDPMVFFSRGLVGVETEEAPQFLQAAYNNRRLVERDFGLTVTNVLQHTPHPLSRSLLADVAARFPEETLRTEHSAFRSSTDVSVTASLSQHVGLATGAAQVGNVTHRYVGLGSGRLERDLRRLARNRDVQTFCIGDAHFLPLGPERVDALVREFLAGYFPDPAPWEKQS